MTTLTTTAGDLRAGDVIDVPVRGVDGEPLVVASVDPFGPSFVFVALTDGTCTAPMPREVPVTVRRPA